MKAVILSLCLCASLSLRGQYAADSVYAIHQVDSIPVIYFDDADALPNRCISNPDCGSGTIFVSFVLNRNGSVCDVKPILGSTLNDCCIQQIRNLLLQIHFKPAVLKGTSVSVRMEVPVYLGSSSTASPNHKPQQ